MSKFRKKPVVIDAIQWLPGDETAVYRAFGWLDANGALVRIADEGELEVHTLEDGHDARVKHVASPGDWIIKGVQGEFYPVKPEIFAETYEAVEQETTNG